MDINERGLGEKNRQGGDISIQVQSDEEIDCTVYYFDLKIRTKKKPVRRAASVLVNPKKIKNSCSKVLKRVKPKLKENFHSGKIIKWNDFRGQELRKKQEKSNLFVYDSNRLLGLVELNPKASLRVEGAKPFITNPYYHF